MTNEGGAPRRAQARRAHAMPFGAEVTEEGVRFALWAPDVDEVTLVLDGADHPLERDADGWRRTVVKGAKAGARYGYRVGDLVVPDPASRFQPDDVFGLSSVVDPAAYAWSDTAWRGRPWEETVLYEAHVGTATPEGTYAALADKLEDLRDLGITAIELLPLAEFPGRRNWGYDGVLHYAPDAVYGTPDDLRRLVERAHALGLMVFVDVVYNHFGPAGNYLNSYACSFFTDRHQTPWGAGINFDGRDSGHTVRDFFVHNALYWLEEFHVDGLRFDAVHAILDDSPTHFIADLAARVRAALPERAHVHLVLENGANEARWLPRDEAGLAPLHTAQWTDDLHHCWHVLLTGEHSGYYEDYENRAVELLGRCLTEGFAYQGEVSQHEGKPRGEPSAHLPPSAFVCFLQNHDQVGNRALGERLAHLVPEERLALARAALLLAPQIPMLFMGEEWSASAPFLYFVDFHDDPALSDAVREGRRREFAGFFAAFSDEEAAKKVPDPTAEETFSRSALDWAERARAPHRDVLADTQALLALRARTIAPLTRTGWQASSLARPAEGALDATWRYAGGTLRMVLNLGETPVTVEGGTVVWSSPGVAAGDRLTLAPWTGAVLTGPAT
jgi:maltooligosyltrehalose trehalohydrolase